MLSLEERLCKIQLRNQWPLDSGCWPPHIPSHPPQTIHKLTGLLFADQVLLKSEVSFPTPTPTPPLYTRYHLDVPSCPDVNILCRKPICSAFLLAHEEFQVCLWARLEKLFLSSWNVLFGLASKFTVCMCLKIQLLLYMLKLEQEAHFSPARKYPVPV